MKNIDENYRQARDTYAVYGIHTDEVLKKLDEIRISLHCWQGDDVTGLEAGEGRQKSDGTLATGNYPGRARNGDELRQDLDKALSLIPGRHKVSLHAMYAETGGESVDRDKLSADHFRKWIDWAKSGNIGLDFNSTYFSHDMAASGYTLSSRDEKVRRFWIEHTKRCREIAAAMGKELGVPCVNNIWIQDGSKDLPADRIGHRKILRESLDEVFADRFDKRHLLDSVECKLFGIGFESYTVGSHEFYMGYALNNKDVMLCLDMGHFHPTESVADKISSLLAFDKNLLIHVSRGVRWDSDHVVILNDDLVALMQEVKRCNAFDRVYFGLDFFDASINRITAWVTGARAALKAILFALLEPTEILIEEEKKGNLGNRLALMEEFKTLPFGAVWNKYCLDKGVPAGADWLEDVKGYEEDVLSKRI